MIKCNRFTAALTIIAAFAPVAISSEDPECGVRVAKVLLEALTDEDVGFLDLKSTMLTDERGISIGQLDDLLKDKGLHTLTARINFEQLVNASKNYACVVHLHPGHFAIASPTFYSPDRPYVTLRDPPRIARFDVEEFTDQWSGVVCVVSDTPINDSIFNDRTNLFGFLPILWWSLLVPALLIGAIVTVKRLRPPVRRNLSLVSLLYFCCLSTGCNDHISPVHELSHNQRFEQSSVMGSRLALAESEVDLGIVFPGDDNWDRKVTRP